MKTIRVHKWPYIFLNYWISNTFTFTSLYTHCVVILVKFITTRLFFLLFTRLFLLLRNVRGWVKAERRNTVEFYIPRTIVNLSMCLITLYPIHQEAKRLSNIMELFTYWNYSTNFSWEPKRCKGKRADPSRVRSTTRNYWFLQNVCQDPPLHWCESFCSRRVGIVIG